MGPKTEFLELARKILEEHPLLVEQEVELAYQLQAAALEWIDASVKWERAEATQ